MTTERLLTEYTADLSNFRRGSREYEKILARQERTVNDRLGRVDKRWDRSTRSILRQRTALSGLTVFLGGAALNQVRLYAEGWKDVERRLVSVGETSEAVQRNLVGVTLRTRSSLGGTAAAIQRMMKSTGDAAEISMRRVETLQKLLASAGASGTERASVSLQLGQALQSGVLSGDEFRSIRENAPVEFLDALARSAGITRGELKKFAEDQKLTTDIVLRALDGLATTADKKFSELAISSEEAFSVLTAGLTVYSGKVDKAFSVTETINGALVWLGEYLGNASVDAETLANSVQLVGSVALAVAGTRGIGALTTAVQRNSNVARLAHLQAQRELATSRDKVDAARREIAASNTLIAQRQADLQARLAEGKATTRAQNSVTAAKRKNEAATKALRAAEARAAIATDKAAAAQSRLALATRAGSKALNAAKGVLAFFGGPVGVAITAMTALPFLLTDTNDRLSALATVSSEATGVIDLYTEATKRAADEQERLKGKIGATTEAMLVQSRAEMQKVLRQLELGQQSLFKDVRGVGFFDKSEITAALNHIENEFQRLYGQFDADNPYLSGVIDGLKELQAGRGDIVELSSALNNVMGLGKEATDVYMRYADAIGDTSTIEVGRQALLDYARTAGIFQDQIAEIEAAPDDHARARAFHKLSISVYDAADAARTFRNDAVSSLAEILQGGAKAELQMQYLRAALSGDADEAARLQALLAGATETSEQLTNVPEPSFNNAIDGAKALAEQLGISLGLAQDLHNLLPSGSKDAIIFDPRDPNYDPNAARLGRIAVGMEEFGKNPGRTSPFDPSRRGEGSKSGGSAKGERELAAARELLLENGQKALYIEQQLNAERTRLKELLPELTSMGLSRAEAEAVINSELARTEAELKKVKTASEEAAASFAKGILEDIRAADSLNDALGRISDRLLDLAYDQAFDLLADQFARIGSTKSGGGGFGWLGDLFGSLFGGSVKAATGGLIRGPGTSTSDSIPAMLSDGEYVVRAKSVTPKTLPFLRALNSGATLPGFAEGGLVSGAIGAAASAAQALFKVEIHEHAKNARAEVKPTADGKGIKVLILDTVKDGILGGSFDKEYMAAFGHRRKPRGA